MTSKRTDHPQDTESKDKKRSKSANLSASDEILPASALLNDEVCVNTIRILCADMVEKANSGHPGAPMGCAPMAHLLFGSIMKYSIKNANWWDRDRFVLSNGHASALVYAMLHLVGYPMSLNDLKLFRQLGSSTPGHPENCITVGIEVSTGPLGQGISNAVGMAIAEKHLAAIFNRDGFAIVDHYTFVICGDGCLQEGISSEACSLAGHLGLGKLIVLYDDNHITIDGDTDLSFTEDVIQRYNAYGWHTQTVLDVNDQSALLHAIESAKADKARPSLIKVRTIIGYGSAKQGTHGVHGAPLGLSDIVEVKKRFGFDPAQHFVVPPEVYSYYATSANRGLAGESDWTQLLQRYQVQYPELAAEYIRRMKGEAPSHDWQSLLTMEYQSTESKAVATRNRSEEVLNAIANIFPELVGGSADLTGSNLTNLKCSKPFQSQTPEGRYFHFGVREHGMAAICNGMFAHGGVRPFCATFLNFLGYALGAVRVSALSHFGILYIMTHDSIGLGEDGPTHQPVEMLEALRTMPNLLTFRPADGNETKGCYLIAMERRHTPSVISLSRQATPTVRNSSAEKVRYGAYILADLGLDPVDQEVGSYPALTMVATGTEVAIAIEAAQDLIQQLVANKELILYRPWVRVVSMPCTELFDEQSMDYKRSIFLPGSPVLSIEASAVLGWQRYAHLNCGIPNCFGYSAPSSKLYEHFGLTPRQVSVEGRNLIHYYQQESGSNYPLAPSLIIRPQPVYVPPSLHDFIHK